jgi:hypothetical protein
MSGPGKISVWRSILRWRWYLLLVLALAVLLSLAVVVDWRFGIAVVTLLGAWLVALPQSPRWLGIVEDSVVLRHDLGWESARVKLSEFDKIVLYRRPIPPGQMRLDVRNRVLHIDSSRVHPACISRFCEQAQAKGREVDSKRIRESALSKAPASRSRLGWPRGR